MGIGTSGLICTWLFVAVYGPWVLLGTVTCTESYMYWVILVTKLECLVALCGALLHPQLNEAKFGVEKYFEHSGWHETSEMHEKVKVAKKLPELPRNQVWGGAGRDRQLNRQRTS